MHNEHRAIAGCLLNPVECGYDWPNILGAVFVETWYTFRQRVDYNHCVPTVVVGDQFAQLIHFGFLAQVWCRIQYNEIVPTVGADEISPSFFPRSESIIQAMRALRRDIEHVAVSC